MLYLMHFYSMVSVLINKVCNCNLGFSSTRYVALIFYLIKLISDKRYKMRYKVTRKVLIFLCLFIGIGALYGSFCMLIDPSGKLLKME